MMITKKPRARPLPMKMFEIHIRKQDYPKQFPPESVGFEALKKSLKKKGMLVPVFVDKDGLLLQGHYRFWAWKELGNKHIPTITVENEEEIIEWFK